MKYIFSVIVPVWNLEKYISKGINSLVNQTFDKPFEIIICLGKSDDNTEGVVQNYLDKYENIKLIKMDIQSVMRLRLKGIQEAKGDYIAFMDADDYYEPNYLEVMYQEIVKGYDVVNCSFYVNKGKRIYRNKFVKEKELNTSEACKALLSDIYMRGFLWSKVFKRELFDINKLVIPKTKENYFEDIMFIFEIFTRAQRIKSIKTPLYHYLCNPKSATKVENVNRINYHLSAFLVIKIICEQNSNRNLNKIFRKKLFKMRMTLLFDLIVTRHVAKRNIFSMYHKNKVGIKILKSRKPVNLDNYEWKQYVLDCLKPIQ